MAICVADAFGGGTNTEPPPPDPEELPDETCAGRSSLSGRLRGEGVLVAGVQLRVERGLLGDGALDLVLVAGDLVERGLPFRERVAVLLRRPAGLLAGDLGLGGQVGVVLGEGSHELEAIGELREAVRAQQDVELRAHAGVRGDGPLRQLGVGAGSDGVGGLLRLLGVQELRLGLLEPHLRLVVLLDQLARAAG